MTDVTRLLAAVEAGDPAASEQLLPLLYDELRRLAAVCLASEPSGQTLQPTALVHEAYLRLLGPGNGELSEPKWDHRGHFYVAAATAMRRILVENARRKKRLRHGGGKRRESDVLDAVAAPEHGIDRLDLLELNEALEDLARHDPPVASFVMLRYFGGLKHEDAAKAIGVSPRVADRYWSIARAWLFRRLEGGA